MDSLPVELLTSIGALLRLKELSNLARVAKKYHIIVTRLLYRTFRCNIPAEEHTYRCNRSPWPCIQWWYERQNSPSWFECSTRWKSDPVIEAFAACSLDQIAIPNSEGVTLLHQYAAYGNTRLVEVFLRKGMHVDTKTSSLSLTPLHFAVTTDGELDTIKLLLSEGADLHARAASGRTALAYAILHRNLDTALDKIHLSTSSYLRNNYEYCGDGMLLCVNIGNGPAMQKRLEIIQLLLDRGADFTTMDPECNSLVHYAVTTLDLELCRTLVTAALRKGYHISAQNTLGETALHLAIRWDRPENVEFLVQNGADILIADNEGLAPIDLLVARCSSCSMEVMLNLADKFVEFSPPAEWRLCADPQTELFDALGDLTRLKILLKFRAAGRIKLDIHRPKGTGPTPLYSICSTSSEENIELGFSAIRALLDAGAADSPEEKNRSLHVFISRWATHDISQTTYYLTLRKLIDSTSNINSQDVTGNTALHFAASGHHHGVAMVLLEEMEKQKLEPLKNNYGYTPLHLAAESPNSFGVLLVLLRSGLDINSRTNDGETPLHIAARKCNPRALKKLLAYGADWSIEDNEGDGPLHKATIPACVAPLLDAGCERCVDCDWCPGSWWDNHLESCRSSQHQTLLADE